MIEVAVTTAGHGPTRKMYWTCPHCGGHHIQASRRPDEHGCTHKYYLRARGFDEVTAVFEQIPKSE